MAFVILSVAFADGGVIIEYARPTDQRAPAFAMSRQLQIPETPALADGLDELASVAERVLARALSEFEMADPVYVSHDDVAAEEEDPVSPYDNPQERGDLPPPPGQEQEPE